MKLLVLLVFFVLLSSLFSISGLVYADSSFETDQYTPKLAPKVGGIRDTPTDSDKDGIPDDKDNCVKVANKDQKDTDGDGIGDACDSTPNGDDDKDGVDNLKDNCPKTANKDQSDRDRDGVGDVCDKTPDGVQKVPIQPKLTPTPVPIQPKDSDRDGIPDEKDNCPTVSNKDQTDTDRDGIGDVCDKTPRGVEKVPVTPKLTPKLTPVPIQPKDSDRDGIPDEKDNCPKVANRGQQDADDDGVGDVCDSTPSGDYDNDGVDDEVDNCLLEYNPGQEDSDNDGRGDACVGTASWDKDSDYIENERDNCPNTFNITQQDEDGDGLGDACDLFPNDPFNDVDGDRVGGDVDNCPNTFNITQQDADGDGLGDACDETPYRIERVPVAPKPMPEKVETIKIPSHVKSIAQFWQEDKIDDDTFMGAVEYMVQTDVIKIPELIKEQPAKKSDKVPAWVKSAIKYWSDGVTTDAEFANSIQYLVKEGIILVRSDFSSDDPLTNTPIWQAKIGIITADVPNAGTNDHVYVSLNIDNITWLDYPENDFEEGEHEIYTLLQWNVAKIGDIDQITIGKFGTDGLCVEKINFYLNDWRAFDKSFSPCLWLDFSDDNSLFHTITLDELQSHTRWDNTQYSVTTPTMIPFFDVKNMLNSMFGNFHHHAESYWGSDGYLGIHDTLIDKIQIRLAHQWEVEEGSGHVYNSFDLEIQCKNGELFFNTGDQEIDSSELESKQITYIVNENSKEIFSGGLAESTSTTTEMMASIIQVIVNYNQIMEQYDFDVNFMVEDNFENSFVKVTESKKCTNVEIAQNGSILITYE